MSSSNKEDGVDEPLYRDKFIEGLHEYVKQDISSFAIRPYDTGKFLFSITSFMMVATLTLVTTFKGDYIYCLLSLIPLVICFKYSLDLTIAVAKRKAGDSDADLKKITGYEINIHNSIYREYLEKYNWLAIKVTNWKKWMVLFSITLTCTIVYATNSFNQKPDNASLMEEIQKVGNNISGLTTQIKSLSKSIDNSNRAELSSEVEAKLEIIVKQLERHSHKVTTEFEENEKHLDRHLKLLKQP